MLLSVSGMKDEQFPKYDIEKDNLILDGALEITYCFVFAEFETVNKKGQQETCYWNDFKNKQT